MEKPAQTSIKKNFLYSLINTISGLLFPLISFPYALRILLAEGIGQVSFFTSIIGYITLFCGIGIPYYAIREIAKVRHNEKELGKTAVEILILHIALTVLGYIAVFVFVAFVAKIQADIPLFLLLSTSILLTAIGAEWFYKGIEDLKYITIRNLVVRSVCLVLLFFLVKTPDDIMWYGAYTVFGIMGGYILNFIRLKKMINFKSFGLRELFPLRHLKPALRVFAINIIASIYVNLNIVMLGFLTDNATVGYYTGATKITQLILGIVTSLSVVMIPRLSSLATLKDKTEFNRVANKAVTFVISISLPLMVALVIMAPTIIRLFCGPAYEPAILTLQIIAPVVFLIALSNVIGIQILFPQGHDNKVIISTAIGAGISFVLNLILIPLMAQNGAAIATVIAESAVVITQIIIGASFIPVKIFNKSYLNYVVASLIMGAGIYGLSLLDMPDIINVIVIPVAGVIIYFFYLYLKKDAFCMEIINLLENKILRR